jgi:hypothetical protein
MAQLPPPSDTPQLVMNIGTLSGIDVLRFGNIEPGARVKLTDGDVAEVLQVRGRRLSRHGVRAGGARVRILNDGGGDRWVASKEIAAVVREPDGSSQTTVTPQRAGTSPA